MLVSCSYRPTSISTLSLTDEIEISIGEMENKHMFGFVLFSFIGSNSRADRECSV